MSARGTDFGTAAAAYEKGRPGYPAESVAFLLGAAEAIADIGAGTGKLTRSLTGIGRQVFAVDPDARMLEALSADLPEVDARVGTAEGLPLADHSMDLLTFGQSWHWVDESRAFAEAARVLAPGRAGGAGAESEGAAHGSVAGPAASSEPAGRLGMIWNIRDHSVEWVRELTRIITPSDAEAFVAKLRSAGEAPVLSDLFGPVESHEHRWVRTLTIDELVAMIASRSYIIAASPEERANILRRTRELGENVVRHDGFVHLPYRTNTYVSEVLGRN